jgi:hypothetical protein
VSWLEIWSFSLQFFEVVHAKKRKLIKLAVFCYMMVRSVHREWISLPKTGCHSIFRYQLGAQLSPSQGQSLANRPATLLPRGLLYDHGD